MQWFRCSDSDVGGGGEEGDGLAAGRFGDGLAGEACTGYLLLCYKTVLLYIINFFDP